MAVFKGEAEVIAEDGSILGSGVVYIHLPRGLERAQTGSATLSLREWEAVSVEPSKLRFAGEPATLAITVTRNALSECSRNRVLRMSVSWPGSGSPGRGE